MAEADRRIPGTNLLADAPDPGMHGIGSPGSGDAYDPWGQVSEKTPGYGRGVGGAVVRQAGTNLAGGARDAYSPAPQAAADQGAGLAAQYGFGGLPAGWQGATGYTPSGGGSGMSGAYTGGGGGGGGGASAGSTGSTGAGSTGASGLPDAAAASQALRDLQMGGTRGLQGLLTRDTTAARKAMEDALYAGQAEGINSAADRARASMLEGTFGRGVGSSSILVELAGRGQQEHEDALARARREAFTQAGAEDRADLASALGLNQAAFGAGTTGLQGEANVRLADLAREQQASQFAQNLGFQGSENAANRAQNASQFSGTQALNYAQLGQQASQFGQNLGFQGAENAANRASQAALAQMGYEFTGGQNQANREFTGGQNQLTRDQQTALAQMGYQFTGGENAANREFQGGQNQLNRDAQTALAQQGYNFQGGQAQQQRDLQRYLAESGNTFSASQNQLTREQSMQQLLLQLANSQDIANSNRLGAGIGAGISGAGALLGPLLAQYTKSLGE